MKNSFRTEGSVTYVYGKCRGNTLEIEIDTTCLDVVSSFKNTWHIKYDEKTDLYYVYGQTWVGRKSTTIKIHRLLTNADDGKVVDHKNGNGLDNKLLNLRVVTQVKNGHNCKLSRNNTSGVNGVSWYKAYGKWRARVMLNYKENTLGYFDEKEDAINAVLAFKRDRGLLVCDA